MIVRAMDLLKPCHCPCHMLDTVDHTDINDLGSTARAAEADDPVVYPARGLKSTDFSFTVERTPGQSLGLDLDIEDGKTAHVCHVLPGPIQTYNRTVEPNKRLEVFDYIVGVNGVTGDSKQILKQISSSSRLEISVKHPTNFSVALDKPDDVELGVEIDYAPNGMSLLVRRVNRGMVREWNAANADRAVQEGDRIIEVNGVMAKETVAPLLKQIKNSERLELIIARPMPGPQGDRGAPMVPTAPAIQEAAAAAPARADEAEEDSPAGQGAEQEAHHREDPEEDPSIAGEGEASSVASGEPAGDPEEQVDAAKVTQLAQMGFSEDSAKAALIATGGNFDEALDTLFASNG